MRSRRRGLTLLAVAVACAAFSASLVSRRANQVSAQIGPLQEVLVSAREIPPETILSGTNADRFLKRRLVAKRFLPAKFFSEPQEVLGLTSLVRIPAGSYLNPGQLGSGRRSPSPEVSAGQRPVDVVVPGSRALAEMLGPGSRVDVLISFERESQSGRTLLAYQDVQVLAVGSPAPNQENGAEGAGPVGEQLVVTLRASLRQAVTLTAAQNFAKQISLLPRSVRDRSHLGGDVTSGGSFGR